MNHAFVKEEISDLMIKIDFPKEAQHVLCSALDKILADNLLASRFDALLSVYDENKDCDYKALVAESADIAASVGIHSYTSQMLLYLALGKRLKERYAELGIDESIFYASMCDLRYKLEECRLVYGEVGSFTNNWFQGFYDLSRFALGRLQFEIRELAIDCTLNGKELLKGTPVINMHIPRTGGPLDHDEVLAAYDAAASFFRDKINGDIIFHCSSWLLDPWNVTVLKPTSNLVAFYNDFTIVQADVQADYSAAWRLFDKQYNGNADELPADSSLRRAYISRIKAGEPFGWGRGLFFYKE